ncbi:MAG: tetratricopeptide repeat protein [Cyanobacteria bacterium P01_D01_bin.128]
MVVTEFPHRQILGLNQQTFQRLKGALIPDLKCQIFIAVCDDLQLQQRFSTQIHQTFTAHYGFVDGLSAPPSSLHTPLHAPLAGPSSTATLRPKPALPLFKSVRLGEQRPDFLWQLCRGRDRRLIQINQAVQQCWIQVTGVERLTQQSGAAQNQFLNSLRMIASAIHQLDCSLLIWLPWPWFRSIQRAAPEFWQVCTGVFEFAGEPTPMLSSQDLRSERPAPKPLSPVEEPMIPRASTAAASAEAPSQSHDLPGTSENRAANALGVKTLTDLNQVAPRQTLLEITLLQRIERLVQQGSDVNILAHAYWTLGQHYRDRVANGDADTELLAAAIAAYDAAHRGLCIAAAEQGEVLNDLGSLYWLQAQEAAAPTQAIALLQKALLAYQQGAQQAIEPAILSRLHSNSAAIYAVLANQAHPDTNLQQAIAAYHRALQHVQPEESPLEYASLQNSLGAIYWRLAQLGPARPHLDQAITAYLQARRHCHPHQDAACYAMIQNNLGIAYWSLAQVLPTQAMVPQRGLAQSGAQSVTLNAPLMLRQAIAAYHSALAYRTLSNDVVGCATTQNNLGTAYWDLAKQQPTAVQRRKLCHRAIAAYQIALKAFQRCQQEGGGSTVLSFNPADILQNLSKLHRQLAEDAGLTNIDRAEHLKTALTHALTQATSLSVSAADAQGNGPSGFTQALTNLAQVVRAHYQLLGLAGQQRALSQVPSALLPQLLPRL